MRIDSLVFSDFLHEIRGTVDAKKLQISIFVENSFFPKFLQKGHFVLSTTPVPLL